MNKAILSASGFQFTLKSNVEFKSLCAPLFNKLPIAFIRYLRINSDKSVQMLCSRPDVLEWYFGTDAYHYGYNESDIAHYKTGFVLSDSWEKSETVIEKITHPFAHDFCIGSELIIYNKSEHYCDILELGLKKDSANANHELMRAYPFIYNFFINHLLISDLHKASNKQTFLLSQEDKDKSDFNIINSIAEHELAQNIGRLTRRELESLYWLSLGKTVPEIAMILQISKRTAECYIIALKEKLKVFNLFQLGQFVGKKQQNFDSVFKEII